MMAPPLATVPVLFSDAAPEQDAGGDDRRALELTQAARRLANPQRDPDLAFQLALREARLRVRLGDRSAANSQYAEALKLASLISVDPAATDAADRARRFRERVSPAFLEYAALLLDSAQAEADDAQQQRTLRTVRRTIEQLKTAELTNYFQDACFAARGDRTRAPQSTNAHTAVLYPIAFEDRLTILISIADVLSAESIQVPRADAVRTVNAFRRAVQNRRDDRSIATLRPVLHRLNDAAIDTLVFVPDRELRLLPWAALFDGQAFVGERYAIAIAPGIELVDRYTGVHLYHNLTVHIYTGKAVKRYGGVPMRGCGTRAAVPVNRYPGIRVYPCTALPLHRYDGSPTSGPAAGSDSCA